MSMRIALIAAAALAAACSSSKPTPMPQAPIGMSKRPVAAIPYVTDINEIRVRFDSDIGVESVDRAFTARLLTPLMRPDGVVFAAAGSLVHGHVVSTSQHRVELAFDRLETRDGVYRIDAVVISAAPYAITVRPKDGVKTSMLEATQPTAMGGGPTVPEATEEEASRAGEVIVPFDADVRLKLTELVRMEH